MLEYSSSQCFSLFLSRCGRVKLNIRASSGPRTLPWFWSTVNRYVYSVNECVCVCVILSRVCQNQENISNIYLESICWLIPFGAILTETIVLILFCKTE